MRHLLPRAATRLLSTRPRLPPRPTTVIRPFSLSHPRPATSPFQAGPSPPRLPPGEQAEFERLQRESEAALQTHTQTGTGSSAEPAGQPRQGGVDGGAGGRDATQPVEGGMVRRGAPAEFEGEVNPRTGEVGGPKNEPLRWGADGDYSFNGRVTDF